MEFRRNSHIRKRLLHFVVLIALMALTISLTQTQVAQAATINVPCDVTDLVNAINTANSNGEADTLNLAPACTYTLTATLDILADGGNPLTIEGNGATISGNNTVQVFSVTSGALNLNNVTVTNGFVSSALTSGGGIVNNVGSTLTLTNSTVSGNTANSGGGISTGGTLTLTNSTVSGNTASSLGGGIANVGTVTLTNSTVSGNTASSLGGGGIYNGAGGTATIANSTVSNNTTTNLGGGIYNDIGSTLTLTNSTISANTANGTSGGIYNDVGTLTLTNSTVAENSAGIFNDAGGTLTLTNSTVASNGGIGIENRAVLTLVNSTVANHQVYGIYGFFGTVNLTNTILANNTVSDCGYSGTITPSGGNLVEDGSCSIAGALSGDPMLGGLTGSPGYFPLLPGSPAIDTGDNGICPATDQRGAARPFDGDGDGTATCDLGSYEVDMLTTPATPTPTSPYTATPTLAAPVATAPPPPDTPRCEDLNFVENGVVRASTRDGLDYAIYCRVLYANGAPMQWLGGDLYNAGSIGHQGVLDLGVVQAVDVYSPVGMTIFEGGIEICLRGTGTLLFMAASGAPRVPGLVSSYAIDDFPGFTCATLYEPGTLVLVRNTP